MNMIVRYGFVPAGATLGAIAGYSYYFWIGCTTGSCPITSDPVNSTLYGALMGGLFVSMFRQKSPKDEPRKKPANDQKEK